jgi:hypothetical protein
MNKQRIKAVALSTVLTAGAVFASSSFASQSLDAILAVGESKVGDAQKSQVRINKLQDETNDLVAKYRQVSKTIEGLKVYNTQMERQLAAQRDEVTRLEGSVGQVSVIQRQVQPLIEEMLSGVEQFIQLDAPYRTKERLARVASVRSLMDSAQVTAAEKFRQVLEIYSIESEYARKVDTYADELDVNGEKLAVDVISVGRIVLAYQTADGSKTGAWDKTAKQWVELDAGQYKVAIRNAIRMAQKKAQNDIMLLPIAAPEAAK